MIQQQDQKIKNALINNLQQVKYYVTIYSLNFQMINKQIKCSTNNIQQEDLENNFLVTENSQYSNYVDEKGYLIQKIQYLEIQNDQYKKKVDYLRKLNQTLSDALDHMPYNKINKQLLKQIQRTFRQKNNQYTENIVYDMKERYQQQIKALKYRLYGQKLQLEKKFSKQLEQLKKSLKQQYEQKLQKEIKNLEKMMKERLLVEKIKIQKEGKIYYQNQVKKLHQISRKQIHSARNQVDYIYNSSKKSLNYRENQQLHHSPYTNDTNKYQSQTKNKIRQIKLTQTDDTSQLNLLSNKNSDNKNSCNSLNGTLNGIKNKNIATDLLCDLCKETYAPMHFFTHLEQCKNQQSHRSNNKKKITISKSKIKNQNKQNIPIKLVSEREQPKTERSDVDTSQMIFMLQQRRQQIENQIQKLKYTKQQKILSEQKKKLQNDLDQIICIIQNKSKNNLKKQIQKILDGKNNQKYSVYQINLDDNQDYQPRYSLGANPYLKNKNTVRDNSIKPVKRF